MTAETEPSPTPERVRELIKIWKAARTNSRDTDFVLMDTIAAMERLQIIEQALTEISMGQQPAGLNAEQYADRVLYKVKT